MGFRLYCKCAHDNSISFYGTKFYGYYKGIDNLPSIKYLESLGIRQAFDMDNETFEFMFSCWTCTPDFTLTYNQFLIFITLYCYDWNFIVDKANFTNKYFENFLEDEDIKKLIASNDDIIICWE